MPIERDGKADDEDRIEPARHRRQDPIGQQRADQHASGVHGTVHAERRREILRTRGERDQRIARSGADALPQTIGRQHRGEHAPRAAGREQTELADRRERVADRRHQLVPPPAIGDDAAGQTGDGRDSLVETIDQAELHRRQLQVHEQIHRQNARDHLRRNVSEAADETEQPDGASDDRTRRGARSRGQETAKGGVRQRDTRAK